MTIIKRAMHNRDGITHLERGRRADNARRDLLLILWNQYQAGTIELDALLPMLDAI
jgi:hypothetical protein